MKKPLWLMAAVFATAVTMTVSAGADEYKINDDVTITYDAVAPDSVQITGINVTSGEYDVTIPEKIDKKTVTKVGIERDGAVPTDKVKSIRFENENNISVIYGNLFAWKNTQKIEIETNSTNDLKYSTAPATETFLRNIPSYITDNYNYDSNNDGTNDSYYVGNSLVRVDTDYSGDYVVKPGTVSILAGAFEGCGSIGAVTLPDTIEWIGDFAFADSSVTSINIPEALMTHSSKIQYATFYNCKQLTTVTLEGREKLNEIDFLAFYGCSGLTGFDFTRVNTVDTLSFYGAFDPDANVAIDLTKTAISGAAAPFSHSGVKSVTFGADFGTIPFEAFYKSALTKIVWDEDVTSASRENKISAWAFADCEGITDDVLEKSHVKYLDYRSFANTSMTELTIPKSVTEIRGGAFAGNELLETLNWKASGWKSSDPLFALLNDCGNGASAYKWDGFSAPSKQKTAKEYTYPTTLNIYAVPSNKVDFFAYQPYLETVHILDKAVTEVKSQAFMSCPNLQTVSFAAPEKITSIGTNAFMGCLSLKEFPFTEMTALNSIGENAFMLHGRMGLCSKAVYQTLTDEQKTFGLTAIDLSKCPAKLSIGSDAFYNQYNAASVHISDGAKAGWAAFNGTASATEFICDGDLPVSFFANSMFTGNSVNGNIPNFHDSLEKVTIGGQIIGTGSTPLFCRMKALKTVSMPNATALSQMAFFGCENLETVSMPSVTKIGENAFRESGLTSVTIQKDVEYGNYAFANCDKLKTVVVEEGVTELSDFMFVGCENLTEVSLPSTLEKINWAAFKKEGQSPKKIGMVEIPASVMKIEDDAFSNACNGFILRGTPEIEAVHEEYDGSSQLLSRLQAIDGSSTVYASDADTAARVLSAYDTAFKAALYGDGYYEIPEQKELPKTISLTLTGAPTEVVAGEGLDLSDFTVTYGGQVLTSDQYELDYQAEDETAGDRIVTVTITDTSLVPDESLTQSNISALTLRGENAQGTVYSIAALSELPVTTFAVRVLTPVAEVQLSQVNAALSVNDVLQLTATVLPESATNKSVVWTSSDPAVATVSDNGMVTALAAGTATITVTTEDGGKTASCVVTVTRKSSGGGSSSSSSSSSSSNTTKTETTTNPDGSTTKTETKSDGTVTSTTTNKDGSSTKTETKKDGSSTTEVKDASGSTGRVSTDKSGKTTATATISEKAVDNAKKSDEAVKLPTTEVKAGESSASAPTVKIDLPKNSGKTKVEIPVKDVTSGTVAIIVKADGTEEIVKDSLPTENGLELTVNGDVTVKIVDNAKNFADTEGHWAESAIDFVSARGLVNGTSDSSFSPEAPTTRAQLWTMLARKSDADLTGGATWYEKAQNWAKNSGISDGTNPNGTITRAEMVTMLWRAAGSPEVSGTADFTDISADSWYAQAVAWAVKNGITTGTGSSKFDPNSTCTRAQIATFLYRTYQAK